LIILFSTHFCEKGSNMAVPDDNTAAAPLTKLLEMGEPDAAPGMHWPDYRSLVGLTRDHIPALIRLATDLSLIHPDDDLDPRGWGPVHAWRALGQLKASEAILPLLDLFHQAPDNDWIIEEMPDVFGLIGGAALPALAAYLRDASHPAYARLVAATCLMEIGRAYPEARAVSIAALAAQLTQYETNSPGMNAVLVAHLVALDAAEQAGLIHQVFLACRVDRFIAGDWRDIRQRLGERL
jgi:hypothetical protein